MPLRATTSRDAPAGSVASAPVHETSPLVLSRLFAPARPQWAHKQPCHTVPLCQFVNRPSANGCDCHLNSRSPRRAFRSARFPALAPPLTSFAFNGTPVMRRWLCVGAPFRGRPGCLLSTGGAESGPGSSASLRGARGSRVGQCSVTALRRHAGSSASLVRAPHSATQGPQFRSPRALLRADSGVSDAGPAPALLAARRGSTADDGKMLVRQRKQEHLPSVLPEFLRRGGDRRLLLLCDCERVRVAGAPLRRVLEDRHVGAGGSLQRWRSPRSSIHEGLGLDVSMQVGLFGVLACGQVSVRVRVGLIGRGLLCKAVCAHEP